MSNDKENNIEIEIKDDEHANVDSDKNESADSSDIEEAVENGAASDQPSDAFNNSSENENYYQQLLRVQAEMQNYKRRTEQRLSEWQANAARDLVQKLLPIVDDFDILFDHHKNDDESISVQGVAMIYNKLMAALKDMGLKPIEAEGKPFDPNFHEAIMAEESDKVEDGHILKVWQKGYTFNDALMRPAKVITARHKKNTGEMNE